MVPHYNVFYHPAIRVSLVKRKSLLITIDHYKVPLPFINLKQLLHSVVCILNFSELISSHVCNECFIILLVLLHAFYF